MGEQPDRRAAVGPDGGERCEHVAVLGQLDLVEPEPAKLLGEQAREVELPRRARVGRRLARRLRVDPDVAQEALEHVVGKFRGER